MKLLSIIITMISIMNCYAQKDKEIINSFIKEIILNEEVDFSKTKKFIQYNKELLNNDILPLLINENIRHLRKELNNNNNEYYLLSGEEIKKKKYTINFQTDYKNIYHLIIDGKVVTSFIINKGKIISFSYNIIKRKDQIKTPFLLNK